MGWVGNVSKEFEREDKVFNQRLSSHRLRAKSISRISEFIDSDLGSMNEDILKSQKEKMEMS